jgi:hypothetical protein
VTMNGDRSCHTNPLATHKIYAEGNIATFTKTILINISRTHGVIDNVFVGAYSSPEEMLGIDPQRVYHELTLLFFKLALRSESNIRRDYIYAFRSCLD